MAEIKISQLPVAGTLSGTETFEIVQSGNSKRVALNAISSLADTFTAVNTYTTSNAPAIVKDTPAGTGAVVSITGNNECGTLVITTGTSAGTGKYAAITFSDAFEFPNGCSIVLQPNEGNSAAEYTSVYATGSVTGFEVLAATALTDSTTYRFNYIVKGF